MQEIRKKKSGEDIPSSAPKYPSASQTCKPSPIASRVPGTPAALCAAAKISSVPLTYQEAKIHSTWGVHSMFPQATSTVCPVRSMTQQGARRPGPSCHHWLMLLLHAFSSHGPSVSSPSLLSRRKNSNSITGFSSVMPSNKKMRTRRRFAAEIGGSVSRAEGRPHLNTKIPPPTQGTLCPFHSLC